MQPMSGSSSTVVKDTVLVLLPDIVLSIFDTFVNDRLHAVLLDLLRIASHGPLKMCCTKATVR